MIKFYDKNMREIGMGEWSFLFADTDYRRVEKLVEHGPVVVSTVWIGISFTDDPTAIFETYARCSLDDTESVFTYSSLEDACIGHAHATVSMMSRWKAIEEGRLPALPNKGNSHE